MIIPWFYRGCSNRSWDIVFTKFDLGGLFCHDLEFWSPKSLDLWPSESNQFISRANQYSLYISSRLHRQFVRYSDNDIYPVEMNECDVRRAWKQCQAAKA